MILDLKYAPKQNKLVIIKDNDFEIIDFLPPYFYLIVHKSKKHEFENIFKTNKYVTDIELLPDYIPIVNTRGSRYEPDPNNWLVYKIKCKSPQYVPKVAEDVIATDPQHYRVSGHNVRYLVRVSFDLNLKFFDMLPLVYGVDEEFVEKIQRVKLLVFDVEADENGKITLVSTYQYTPLEEVRKEAVKTYLANELDEFLKEIEKARAIAGHNIIGYDIPVLGRNGYPINTVTKLVFDTSQMLAQWAQSLGVGSARSLDDVSEVLKEEAGVTDEEIDTKRKGKKLLKMKNPPLNDLIKYNVNDVVLTAKILNVIYTFATALSGLTQIPLTILQTLTAGLVAEYWFLRWCEVHGYIPEYRKVVYEVSAERAYAKKEMSYISGPIYQFDVNMMYPSFVLANYIDPTLLVKEGSTEENIQFDRRSGLGILWSAVRYLREIRTRTKALKKKNKLFEPVDKGVKAVLNALAYGVQGKQGGYTPLGNPACPTKIFLGTYRVQMSTIQYLKSKGIDVIYSDSITGETPVIVSINGKIIVVPIKILYDVIEEARLAEKLVGDKEYLIPKIEIYSLSFENNRPCWKRIKALIRHKTKKKIYKVRTKYGYFEVTEDHSIMSRDGRFVKPIEIIEGKAEPMAIRERIELPPNLNTPVEIVEPPSIDWGCAKYCDVEKLKQKLVLYSFFNTCYEYKNGELNLLKVLEPLYRKQARVIRKDDTYLYVRVGTRTRAVQRVRYRFSKSDGSLEKLVYALGFYLGGGSVSIARTSTGIKYNLRFSNTDERLLEKLKECLETIFPDSSTHIIDKQYNRTVQGKDKYVDKTKHLQIGSKIAVLFFVAVAGFGKYKHVPSFIYELEDDYKLQFLMGYIHADGSIFEHPAGTRYYNMTTKNRILATGFSLLLTLLGMNYLVNHGKNAFTLVVRSKEKKRYSVRYEVEERDDYVYDIDVEDGDTFVCDVGLVVAHNTDSFYVYAPNKKPEEIEQIINNYLAKFGLTVSFEGVADAMYIYSRKCYVLYMGNKVKVKGSVFHSKKRYYLPVILRKELEKLLTYDPETRGKVLYEIIQNADIEDLFIEVLSPLWRTIGKDVQAAKRDIKRGKLYYKARTPWPDMPVLYLKKSDKDAQWLKPENIPLLTLLVKSGGTVNLEEYDAYTIIEGKGLYFKADSLPHKRAGTRLILYIDGNLYGVDSVNIQYIMAKGELIKRVHPKDTVKLPVGFRIIGIEGKLGLRKLNLSEDELKDLVLLHVATLLSELGFPITIKTSTNAIIEFLKNH